MDENSTPEERGRATNAAARIAQIGIPKQELAQRAGVDRGTLGRALKADPRITDRTWVRIERVLGQLEEEIGLTAPSTMLATETTASGESVVQSVVEYRGARITLSGRADAVAEAIRRVLDEGRSDA
jgi:hypothetical protein